MIPSLPETVSATHVEYLPSSAVYFKSFSDNSRCGSLFEANCQARGSAENDQLGQRLTEADLTKIRALRAVQQFIPFNLSTVPSNICLNYFRGNDLHYAPHVGAPAAESVENL